MTRDREIEIERTSLGKVEGSDSKEEFLIVNLTYQLGGVNWFTGRDEGRGFYVHVSPITEEKRDGYTMRGFSIGTGLKHLIHPAKMFSLKTLERLAVDLKDNHLMADTVENMKRQVMEQRAAEHQRSYDMGYGAGYADQFEGKPRKNYSDAHGHYGLGYSDGFAMKERHLYVGGEGQPA